MLDITTLAAWGEFIGGIAVVVSLIYLASQIRQNTKTIRASNFGEHLTEIGQFAAMLVDPDTASLYLRGLDDFGGLSSEDQVRFTGLMSQEWNRAWKTLHLHQQVVGPAIMEPASRLAFEEGNWRRDEAQSVF